MQFQNAKTTPIMDQAHNPAPLPKRDSQLEEILHILRRLDPERPTPIFVSNGHKSAMPDQLVDIAKQTIQMRTIQRSYLPTSYCDEPALNILLDIYIAHLENRIVYVNDACIASQTPTSTALRWIAILVRDGFATRIRDNVDARRTILEITPAGRDTVSRLLHHWAKV